jgi:hypothetical protein
VSPVKYELGFYIPEDDILQNHCRENLKSYNVCSCSFVLFQVPGEGNDPTEDVVPSAHRKMTTDPFTGLLGYRVR